MGFHVPEQWKVEIRQDLRFGWPIWLGASMAERRLDENESRKVMGRFRSWPKQPCRYLHRMERKQPLGAESASRLLRFRLPREFDQRATVVKGQTLAFEKLEDS